MTFQTLANRRRIVIAVAATLSLALALAGTAASAAPRTADSPEPTATSLNEDMFTSAELLGATPAPESRGFAVDEAVTASASVQANHVIDVAVVVPSDVSETTSFISDSDVDTLVSQTAAYWKVESNNQVVSLTRDAAIIRYSSAFSCSDQYDAWDEAATAFGRNFNAYLTTSSRHLLVLTPVSCGEGGVGSVGTGNDSAVGAANGGLVWTSVGPNALDVVTHEFGHNLGLQHSNTLFCTDPSISEGQFTVPGSAPQGCADEEYGDAYDVMGAAWSVGSQTNERPTALNVTHKRLLSALTSGEMRSIALPSGRASYNVTTTLASTGTSGQRALRVTDPGTGAIYYVDYRGGGGSDASSLYASGRLDTLGVNLGVRVLTQRPNGESILLPIPGENETKLYMIAGEQMFTGSRGVSVAVESIQGGIATVAITVAQPAAVERLAGAGRFETSAAISSANFAPGVAVAYVTSGLNFPDALSGASVAGSADAPILLVEATSVPGAIQSELLRLKPQRIVLLGGTAVITNSVESALDSYTEGTVTRLSGADRYATSAAISARSFAPGAPVAYVANGLNFPDALSGAAAAGTADSPVLLVNAASIPADIGIELDRLQPQRIVVLGGTTAISEEVETALVEYSTGGVTRLSGADRFDTSAIISQSSFPADVDVVYVVNGLNFPDALSGAAVAGSQNAPVLLVQSSSIPTVIQAELRRLNPARIVILGGVNVLSDTVSAQLAGFLR
ncbi:cell wall-binding repeat-containing protein [Cryobacterium sp. TMS1-13-1]|uniref:cell wall-binding repeat-containing protein n=1 Tax=Cryobacterium sp. TMS1-13-1 TaxID=1259220 RepID=UPI00141B571B|nr:cell wall-binding repeat-containing protein [Cryobacterium sp. TMS1-13-1]